MCCPNFDALLDPFPGEVCIDVLPSTLGGVGARRVVPIRGVGLVMYPLRVPDKVDRFGAICEEDGEPMLLRAGRDGETGRRGDGVAGHVHQKKKRRQVKVPPWKKTTKKPMSPPPCSLLLHHLPYPLPLQTTY